MNTKRISSDYLASTKVNFDFFEICITSQILEDKDTLNTFLFDCQCALLLIDITDKESLNKLKELFESIDFSEFSILKLILVENKIDLENQREIEEESIKAFMEENNIEEKSQISIKEGQGMDELIEKMNKYTSNPENDIPINYIAQDKSEKTNVNLNLKKNINLILIGDSNVGKTCFFTRVNKNQFHENFLSTIGIDKYTRYYKYKDEEIKVTLCDTAGQDRFKCLPKKYYQNADGIFIFYDVSNKESFTDVSVWMKEINDFTNLKESEGSEEKKITVFLVGNKIDKLKRCVSKEEAEEKASFYGIEYFETSCKLNMNIVEVTTRMINECYNKLPVKIQQTEVNINNKNESFKLKNEKKKDNKKKKSCC